MIIGFGDEPSATFEFANVDEVFILCRIQELKLNLHLNVQLSLPAGLEVFKALEADINIDTVLVTIPTDMTTAVDALLMMKESGKIKKNRCSHTNLFEEEKIRTVIRAPEGDIIFCPGLKIATTAGTTKPLSDRFPLDDEMKSHPEAFSVDQKNITTMKIFCMSSRSTKERVLNEWKPFDQFDREYNLSLIVSC